MVFPKTISFVSTYLLLLQLLALSTQNNLVHAAQYSFVTPTSATLWTAGQPGQVTIVSQDKATSASPTNGRLLTIDLCVYKNIFQPDVVVATIKDHVQLLVPFGSTETQVSLTINDFVVPATVSSGSSYFVRLSRYDGLFDQETDKSPQFQIMAAVNPTTPGANSTITSVAPTATTNSTLIPTPTNTTTSAPTPTPTQTCDDIKQQCAAQAKAFINATATTPCSCGSPLIVPTVIVNGASSTIQSTTGGPTAALVVLLLTVMTLF